MVPRVYSYQDVAEAMVVHELVERNLSLKAIKATIELLREQQGTGWPLSDAHLEVPRDPSPRELGAKKDVGVKHTIIFVGIPDTGDHLDPRSQPSHARHR